MNSLSSLLPPDPRIGSDLERRGRSAPSPGRVLPVETRKVFPEFFDDATLDLLQQLDECCRERRIAVDCDELIEWGLFQAFLASHVIPKKTRDVSCMVLWAEWVRFLLPRTRQFPSFINEKEFRTLIVGLFGSEIEEDDERGPVYPGLQFVLKKGYSSPDSED